MNRASNARVGSAATDIAPHADIDFFISGIRPFPEQHRRSHDLSRLAIAALRHILADPGLLQGMRKLRREPFDGDDLLAFGARDRRNARSHRFAVQMNRAGAALCHSTAKLRSRQADGLAQHPQQWRVRAYFSGILLAIDFELFHTCDSSPQTKQSLTNNSYSQMTSHSSCNAGCASICGVMAVS